MEKKKEICLSILSRLLFLESAENLEDQKQSHGIEILSDNRNLHGRLLLSFGTQ